MGVTESHVQTRPTGSNTSKPVQTRPNEICFMHNFHAILNDCKVMYFKYINSFARNLFVFCLNLKILVKNLVGCSCHVPSEKRLINFCLLSHDDLFCSRGSQQFPIYLSFSQPSHLINITQRITYKRYCRDATFLTHLLGVRLFTKH